MNYYLLKVLTDPDPRRNAPEKIIEIKRWFNGSFFHCQLAGA
jgi:hypothetical protein